MSRWVHQGISFALAAALLASPLASQARAESPSNEAAEAQAAMAQIDGAVDLLATQIEAMSDEDVRALMLEQAHQLDQMANDPDMSSAEKVELSAAAQDLRADASNPQAQPKKKIVRVLKKIGRAIGIAGLRVIQSVGYVSEGVNQAVSIPVRLVYKFFRGLITGQSRRAYRPIVMSGQGDLGYVYMIGIVLLTSPDPVTKAIGITMMTLTHGVITKAVCQNLDEQRAGKETKRYCANIGKIDRLGYRVTGAGDVAGAAIHNLFKKKSPRTQ